MARSAMSADQAVIASDGVRPTGRTRRKRLAADQGQLLLDELVTAAAIDENGLRGDVSPSALPSASNLTTEQASSSPDQGEVVGGEPADAGSSAAVRSGATRGVVRRLDDGLRRIEVLLARAHAEQRMADATAAQAAHEAAKLAARTKVPIEVVAMRAGIPIASVLARREILDQRQRRP